ncbi:MAG: hypothetical protein ABWZ40_03200 [Caulobacterales bacterium]
MSETSWTLGKLKSQNMQIHALCSNERCGQMFIADTEALIAAFGPHKPLSEFNGQTCEACNSPLRIRIGFAEPDENWDDETDIEPDDGSDDRHWD